MSSIIENRMVRPSKLTDGCSIRVPAPGAVLRFSPNPLVVSGPKFCDSGKFRFRVISSKDIWPARPRQLVNVISKSALLNKTHASQNFPHLELCFDSYRFLVCIAIYDVRVALVDLGSQGWHVKQIRACSHYTYGPAKVIYGLSSAFIYCGWETKASDRVVRLGWFG